MNNKDSSMFPWADLGGGPRGLEFLMCRGQKGEKKRPLSQLLQNEIYVFGSQDEKRKTVNNMEMKLK